ncbi:hypothetical protein OG501_11565 [Streptomyces niveus]|uniref:hypothetical protein n=1 Tax=Streptomyces niveus TaxID=193462 RepID=UPI00387021D8
MDAGNPGEFLVRRARAEDAGALIAVDSLADDRRQAAVRRWCQEGSAVVAEGAAGPVGYCVVEYTFFEQGLRQHADGGTGRPWPGSWAVVAGRRRRVVPDAEAVHLDERSQPAHAAAAFTAWTRATPSCSAS